MTQHERNRYAQKATLIGTPLEFWRGFPLWVSGMGVAKLRIMEALTESESNVLGSLCHFGATPLDQFWLLTCIRLKKKGLVSIYGRTVSIQGERPGKAFCCPTSLGWEVAAQLRLYEIPEF